MNKRLISLSKFKVLEVLDLPQETVSYDRIENPIIPWETNTNTSSTLRKHSPRPRSRFQQLGIRQPKKQAQHIENKEDPLLDEDVTSHNNFSFDPNKEISFEEFLKNIEKVPDEYFLEFAEKVLKEEIQEAILFENPEQIQEMNETQFKFDTKTFNTFLKNLNDVWKFTFPKIDNLEDFKEGDQYIFHSECIFDKKENNDQQVTLYISSNRCHMNCSHDKSKLFDKYKEIQKNINSQ